MSKHDAYLAAPTNRRWISGNLKLLWLALEQELEENPVATAWRVLPGGALVSLARMPNDGNVRWCRIARDEKPKTPKGQTLFDREVATFALHFDIEHWRREQDPDAKGIAMNLVEPGA